MTAHSPRNIDISHGDIMIFDDVKYSIGIPNVSAYKNTGKFICELEGLYIVSASVMSYTSTAQYYIKLNGNLISETNIGHHSGIDYFTGAVTVTRKLNPADQVWLEAYGSWNFHGGLYSKFTIIKIK